MACVQHLSGSWDSQGISGFALSMTKTCSNLSFVLQHNIVFVRGYRVHFVVISAVALTLFIVIHVYNLVHRKYPVSILFLLVGSCVMIGRYFFISRQTYDDN